MPLPAAALMSPPTPAARGVRARLLTPRERPAWDQFVTRHPQGTLFHTVAWNAAVEEVFGHAQFCLYLERDAGITAVLPLALVKSAIAGRMLVSVPYAVGGGILADEPEDAAALWGEARVWADRLGACTIDLRSAVAAVPDLPVLDRYVGFRKPLPVRSDQVLPQLPRKARAEARHARERHGLIAEFDRAHLDVVWRLYARSMRRLGSLCYPYRLFLTLCERFGRDAWVQIVRHQDRTVGGLVSFRFRDAFMPYFAGCDERYNHLATNNYLYLAAMEHAVDLGCREFDFGRTRRDNIGAFDFKRFQGFSPVPLEYQSWQRDGVKAADLTPAKGCVRLARRVWRHLPATVVEYLGAWASRHIPG